MSHNPLIINVDKMRVQPLRLDLELDPPALDLNDPEFEFESPVRLAADFHAVGMDVIAHGEISVGITTPCVRCLKPTRFDLKAPVDETWMKSGREPEPGPEPEEEPLIHEYAGDDIDITEVLRELVMSELPERVLCEEACRGLCPGCGADLNTEACRCAPAEQAARAGDRLPDWKKTLKDLKLQD